MHGHRHTHIDDPGPLRVSPAVSLGFLIVGIIGLLITAVGLFTGTHETKQNTWAGFFISTLFFWFIAMGASAFLAIQYITKAKWFYVIKRLPESLASFTFRGGFILPLLILAGTWHLYPWADSSFYSEIWPTAAPDYPYAGTVKYMWLSPTVHIFKVLVYILVPTAACFLLIKASQQPSDRDPAGVGMKRLRISIIYIMIFGFLFSLYAWEAVMSVEPRWFSTMFGVYCFAGAFVSALSVMMLMSLFILKPTVKIVPGRQMYDLGTYVMAFATFMIYIGFSQFMLIWYANIYDETFYFLKRYEAGWAAVTIALPVLKWIIPFFVLMPPPFRTNRIAQAFVCLCILVGQLLDLYWMIVPAYSPEGIVVPGIYNIAAFIGVGGLFCWSTLSYLGSNSLLPVKDAELLPSVNGDYLHA